MTLRLRLVLTLVLLAAGGLLVLGGVTYATQRSFQERRVDDQTRAAEPALGRQLDRAGAVEHSGGHVPVTPIGSLGLRFGRGPGPRGGPDPSRANLPSGTYGERRDGAGARLGAAVVISYGEPTLPAPDIPGDIRAGDLVTVGADGESGLQYRVRASPTPGGTGLTLVAIPLDAVDEALDRLVLVLAVVIAAVLVLLGGLAWLLVGSGLRPLQRMGDTAGAIVAGDLARRVQDDDPRTEVGRLGLALNEMLARLEQAFAEREASEGRLRRFLSDASHELRTPLASIRGYAELFRMGALDQAEDAAAALRRIEDEATRMGVLVEDLLVLARLDELRDPARVEVDLGVLVHDGVADARAIAPMRTITAQVDPRVRVAGDSDALRQILANLLRNALVHTPPDADVEVGADRVGDRVRLHVRDHGPGLPPGDPAQLFDRFWRAEGAGRQRGRDGAGLGLSIVAAIAHAHGGTVTASDMPGGGARFVVELPALVPETEVTTLPGKSPA